MKKKLASTKDFVVRHQTVFFTFGLAVTTVGTILMFTNQRQFNEFLKEHDLLDVYYALEEV